MCKHGLLFAKFLHSTIDSLLMSLVPNGIRFQVQLYQQLTRAKGSPNVKRRFLIAEAGETHVAVVVLAVYCSRL
jgi:hypothetical protein